MSEREVLAVDALFVGAGPAGLGGAIRLAQLAKEAGKTLSIAVVEKAREVGAHACSGAVMEPKALRELIPEFEAEGAPIESSVEDDAIYFLTENECSILPFTPPSLRNHGKLIVSLGRLTRWLAKKAEGLGVDVFPGFAAVDAIIEEGGVRGIRTGDRGVGRDGARKANFEPGVDIRAKVTVVGEGPRGSLTRILTERFGLDKGRAPQVYATGVKEIWQLPEGRTHRGRVIHTMGWPLKGDAFGGGFIYTMSGDRINLGFVVGLDYRDPFLDPHHELQRFKTHPSIRSILEGGEMVEYGAKTIPEGGWEAVPRLQMDGAMLVGDSAGFLDARKLKGVHLALKSGMLAAETAFEAIEKGDVSESSLSAYAKRVEGSYIRDELWKSRNFKKGFKWGFTVGVINAAMGEFTKGFSLLSRVEIGPGHERMRTVRKVHGVDGAEPDRIPFDDKLTFSKTSALYRSGTKHEEDQPCHLHVLEPDLCVDRCTREFGNPCQHFCPAAVYEWVKKDESDVGSLQINASNCVHCKTCDVMDPYGVIRWVPPEGGGGPAWETL